MADTLLVIVGPGIPLYSARGLTQTLTQIPEGGDLQRDVNGTLVNLSPPQFHKYASSLSCTDMRAPAIDGLWIGAAVTIDCVQELAYPTGGTPQRTVVDGSTYTEGSHTFYRPRLDMMVKNFSTSFDEWGAAVAWSVDLEEV